MNYVEIWFKYSKSITNFNSLNCPWPSLKISRCLFCSLPGGRWLQIEPRFLNLHANDESNVNMLMLKYVTNSSRIQIKMSEINTKLFFSLLITCCCALFTLSPSLVQCPSQPCKLLQTGWGVSPGLGNLSTLLFNASNQIRYSAL